MPRWAFMSLAILTGLAAALGLRLGWMTATLDESRIIERYAGVYEAAGGARAECHARPGERGFERLVVVCTPPDRPAARHVWAVGPWGQLLRADTPRTRDSSPEDSAT
ncbi:MAG: hypothetical protein HLUCCA24_01535 [Rhodobacteraceae bacterium HLUCCA24]|nr:MAG: hypothetical protein HLUCCA24_01535 [Rhodobacteraceae bacterium HLUCCA24]